MRPVEERLVDFRLEDGTPISANRQILGINPQGEVFEGYDGTLRGPELAEYDTENFRWNADFSPAQRQEIAAYMMALWQRWATEGTWGESL